MAACPVGRVPPDMRKDGYFMKSMKRRLLSLFMAMVMVCSLVPVALAAGETLTVSVQGATSSLKAGDSITVNATLPTGFNASEGATWTWTAEGTGAPTVSSSTSSLTVTLTEGTYKFKATVSSITSTTDSTNVVSNVSGETAEITVSAADTPLKIELGNPSPSELTVGSNTTARLSATLSGTGADTAQVEWSANPQNIVTVTPANDTKSATIAVAQNANITSSATVTITAAIKNGTNTQKDTKTITVKPAAIPAASIALTGSGITGGTNGQYTLTLPAGSSVDVTAQLKDANNGNVSGTVNVSGGTATVCSAGTMTNNVVRLTAANVTAQNTAIFTFTSGSLSATLTVTVVPVPYIVVDGNATSIAAGQSIGLTLQNAPVGCTVTWRGTTGLTFSPDATLASTSTTMTAASTMSPTSSAKITATVSGTGITTATYEKTIAVTNPLTIYPASKELTAFGAQQKLTARFNSIDLTSNSGLSWSIVGATNSYSDGYISLSTNTTNGSVLVTAESPTNTARVVRATYVTTTGTYYADCPITVKFSAAVNPSVTVYDGNPGYALTDDPDEGRDSIADQIDDWVESRYRSTRYSHYEIEFSQAGESANKTGYLNATKKNGYDYDELADVIFEPNPLTGSTKSASASYNFDLYVYSSSSDRNPDRHTGTVTFNIKPGSDSSGDIVYSASLGQDVSFDVSDFEDFYSDKYSRGYLEYVTFGSSTANGTLYNEDGKSAGSSSYYVDPSSRQKGLDGIYFSPKSTMKKSTTVKISFTAYGTTRDNSGEGKAEGTVTIIYLNDSAKDITYNTTAGKVTLSAQDFIDAYKEATGSKTAPSNLTIEFQNIPSNGTLTYTGGSKDKDLTKSNVKSNRYTTKNSGSYRLAQLTYTGTKGKDTIDYIAYSGSTAQFTGKVVFNGTAAAPTDVVVTYGSTGGQAVRFSQNDFVSANSAMSKATKVRFVAPANGTLLMNGANASGVDIATTLLGTVTYQPKSGFNGQDKIIFAAYDASNNTVASGTVNITVIGNPTTGTTPGGTPGGVSDVSQFKDVSATAWYRDNLATLVRKGIITGKGDGKFDPLGTVTYGEALKMVLESCGYTAALGTGSQWAINYKNLAVSRGWISSDIDLNAAISRNATAELTAKVLGVSAVTSGSPFADEANGYAAALYYTSPQIFAGSPNPNGGKPLFKNSSPLLRQEVCAVICRVSDYHAQHTTNNMPDGI